MKTFILLAMLAHPALVLAEYDAVQNRPVTKVITLLKDLLKQVEAEGKEDEEVYNKLACWCTTNDKEKSKAIADAEAKIERLENQIEKLTAKSARLAAEIEQHKKELAEDIAALEKATTIREKGIAAFKAEEKDLLESISALKAAIEVLSKHHEAEGFLQSAVGRDTGSVAETIRQVMLKHNLRLQEALTPSEKRTAVAFAQDYFDAAPTFKQSYHAQSGEIFGILKQMQETFEADLKAAQEEETAAQKAFEELKAAKEEEIKTGKAQIESKTLLKAETDQKKVEAEQDLEDTKNSLSADQKYLLKLKEKCSLTDKEWEERLRTRQLEMEALTKAIAMLNSDEAHDTFSRTFNPSFAQKTTVTNSAARASASKLLEAVSRKVNNPRLATLAVQVRLDAFTRVKKAIDDMIAQLLTEKEDEIKHKDFCVGGFNENELETDQKNRDKTDLENKIADLEARIKKLKEEIATLKSEIAELQVQLKEAGEDRDRESRDFQATVADQRETQKLLKAALEFLESFYGGSKKENLLQRDEPVGPPPPEGFKEYNRKSEEANGVLGMIRLIIKDAEAMEQEAIKSEEDAQTAYGDYANLTNDSIETKVKEIFNKEDIKAKAEEDLAEAKEDREAVISDLEKLADYKKQLHKSCDFVLKNFDIRQTARDEEVEALRQAKAILSGAKFEEFLQSF